MSASSEWQVYRTRFLIRAKQLTAPLMFVDSLGREHNGDIGDYLVESSDGCQRIAPREIFEDIYVPMGPADADWSSLGRRKLPLCTSRGSVAACPASFQPKLGPGGNWPACASPFGK